MEMGKTTIIGEHSSLVSVFRTLHKVAPTDSTVLVTGESGTGKECIVRALHEYSTRKGKPFVPINCGAIPKELLESELFGHEKGAFTHAVRTRAGRFELAEGGTVFLDEIGEMDLSLQVKILRVLQEREYERVGGTGLRKADVRIIAATNRDLEAEVAAGNFREDLYYRLNVIPLHLPPLRSRGEDIFMLAAAFFEKFSRQKRNKPLHMHADVKRIVGAYSWPGNVRELENLAERLTILCDDSVVQVCDLPEKILRDVGDIAALPEIVEAAKNLQKMTPAVLPNATGATNNAPIFYWPRLHDMQQLGFDLKNFLDEIEEKLLLEALANAEGVKNQAAEILGVKRTTLIEKLKKRHIE